MNRLKLACLKQKSVLWENELLQIGHYSSLQDTDGVMNLVIMLFFGNKSQSTDLSNLSCKYSGDNNIQLWNKPSVIQSVIEKKHQAKQELIIQFSNLPYDLLTLEVSYRSSMGETVQLKTGIPMAFIKFFQERHLPEIEFKTSWEACKDSVLLRSDRFQGNLKIVSNIYDLKKMFRKCTDLSQQQEYSYLQGQSDYKVGLVLALRNIISSQLLVKVIHNADKSL